MIELGALAVCTFAAIATDDHWQRRGKAKQSSGTSSKQPV
jgi:hypothetical protein